MPITKEMERLIRVASMKMPGPLPEVTSYETSKINVAELPFLTGGGDPLYILLYASPQDEPEVAEMKVITRNWINSLNELKQKAIRRLALEDAAKGIEEAHS